MNSIDPPNGDNAPPANDCPPVAGTTEGASIAVGANAMEQIARDGGAGKAPRDAEKYGLNTRARDSGRNVPAAAYRGSTGRIWAFTGKRARVLALLARNQQGLTPWDCWPWHTRLGASIHVLREAGLAIETVREGEFRHVRYFLRTPGGLIKQPDNREGDQ